jgi:hypothetical protein
MATVTQAPTQPTVTISKRTGRRIGYVVAILVNLAFLAIINVWPGWEAMPFVTADAVDVVPLVNATIVVTMLANVLYIIEDRPRFKAAGEVITGLVGIVALSATLSVYPFDFSAYTFPWEVLTTFVLWIALIGTGISIIVNLFKAFAGPRQRTSG